MDLNSLKKDLQKGSDKKYAAAERYFKTGKGEYGEGDFFLGIRVPALRAILKPYTELSFDALEELSRSPVHEERMAVLFILVWKYSAKKISAAEKKTIYDWYISHTHGINNWDLVDLSAPYIPGDYLFDKNRSILKKFAGSENLWERRIAIITTHGFIKRGDFTSTFEIADLLLHDEHDLIHKAVGWMLREAGKKDLKAEETFLKERYRSMPRTMLRYAIEKFPEIKRKDYLEGRI